MQENPVFLTEMEKAALFDLFEEHAVHLFPSYQERIENRDHEVES
jgi:hypothetical protein